MYLGRIVAPPSVMLHRPDFKSGAKIRWQGLLVFLIPSTPRLILVMPNASQGRDNYTCLSHWV